MDDYSSVNVAHPEEGSPMKSIRGGGVEWRVWRSRWTFHGGRSGPDRL